MVDRIELPPKKPLSRLITAVFDVIPTLGKIKQHVFTTTLGAGVTYTRTEDTKYDGFYLSVNGNSQIWTSQELRELSAECLAMAEYLEKTFPTTATTELVSSTD